MFKFTIPKLELIDLIRKMALPYGQGKYVFDKIAPKFLPNGYLEWVGKNKNTTVWVRARNLTVSGITETMRVPFVTKELIATLDFFENDAIVTIAHDTDRLVDRFESDHSSIELPMIPLEDIKGMQEGFNFKFDPDGVIIYHDGNKPNLHARCTTKIFHMLINYTYKVMGAKRKDEIPNIYHITFDGDHQFLRTIAGDEYDKKYRAFKSAYHLDYVVGQGETHYAQGFQEVMEVLSGEIEISAQVNGHLWIVQRRSDTVFCYLITPATYR
jgi:hypothetical protein